MNADFNVYLAPTMCSLDLKDKHSPYTLCETRLPRRFALRSTPRKDARVVLLFIRTMWVHNNFKDGSTAACAIS